MARGLVDEHRLTDEHRQAILAAIPARVKAKANWPELEQKALADLDEIVAGYRTMHARRQRYPLAKERKRWHRIGDLTEKLAVEMRELRREIPWNDPDPLWPNRFLTALWEIHNKVQFRFAWHDTWAAFRGTQNPHREFLYWGVLRVWTERLDGQLKYSLSPKGEPIGPLVRFFITCVEPVLDAETPRAGVADIIDRERNRRAKHPV